MFNPKHPLLPARSQPAFFAERRAIRGDNFFFDLECHVLRLSIYSEPMVSEESMADKHKKEMKQLEDELFDAQKRIKDLEEEISKATDTKALKEQLCSKESAAEEDAIVSVKVLTESGSQTDMLHPETVVVPSQVETYGGMHLLVSDIMFI